MHREADRDRHFAVAAPLARRSICDDRTEPIWWHVGDAGQGAGAERAGTVRFKLGTIEATAVSDGPLSIGEPKNTLPGPTAAELGKMMSDNFLPTNNVGLDQTVLVMNAGVKLAWFETGMSSVKRNDDMGRLAAILKQAGIDPADVDAVIPTHAHIDHIGGVMAADGSRNFPNAQIYISQADLEFWTDDKRLGPPPRGPALAARQNHIPHPEAHRVYQ